MHSHRSYTTTMVQRLMALGGQGGRGGDQAMQSVAHQTPDGLQTRGCRNEAKKNSECPIRPTMAVGG